MVEVEEERREEGNAEVAGSERATLLLDKLDRGAGATSQEGGRGRSVSGQKGPGGPAWEPG